MRIAMVLREPYPPDIRVDKEVTALLRGGHEVFLLALARNEEEVPEESIRGLRIRRVPLERGLRRRLGQAWYYLTFRDRHWSRAIDRFIADFAPDAFHVHDLPLATTVIEAARKASIPVVLDLHENYPAAVGLWSTTRSAVRRWLTASPSRWLRQEARAVARASHVVVVVDEAKTRVMTTHRLSASCITTVMNVDDLDDSAATLPAPAALEGEKAFRMLYAGGGGRHRGLEMAIASLQYLRDLLPRVELRIVGPKPHEIQQLESIAAGLGVGGFVRLASWQPMDVIRQHIRECDVCLVPHEKNPHTDATIPHKLFQYMAAFKPVVVSDCAPLQRIVMETGAGLVFASGEARDLADQIRLLHSAPDMRRAMGIRGREAVVNRYNWSRESQGLLAIYRALPTTRRSA